MILFLGLILDLAAALMGVYCADEIAGLWYLMPEKNRRLK